jgi:ATP-binding cassette subfamily F protein uup
LERDARVKSYLTAENRSPGRLVDSKSSAAPAPARARKLSFKEQRELDGMESAVLAAETRAAQIEATLADPKFFSTRAAEANGLIAELDALKLDVTRLYARWQELDAIGK